MKISGKKGYYRHKDADRKRIEDGKEIVIEGKWHKIYAEVAPAGDDVYVPVVEEHGLTMWRLKDLTLKVKTCRMVNLPGQKISFLRKDPDKDITTFKDQHQRLIPGEFQKHTGRIGFDISRVCIPLITTEGERVPIRLDNFVFEEKSKGAK